MPLHYNFLQNLLRHVRIKERLLYTSSHSKRFVMLREAGWSVKFLPISLAL